MENHESLDQEFNRKEEVLSPAETTLDEERGGDLYLADNIKKLEATENVAFFPADKTLEDIQNELELAGWVRRGPYVPDLRSAPVDILVEHLGDPHYKIVIQGRPPKTVTYFVSPSAIN
jgi:hypothetical protein